jgi:hypothetical protein
VGPAPRQRRSQVVSLCTQQPQHLILLRPAQPGLESGGELGKVGRVCRREPLPFGRVETALGVLPQRFQHVEPGTWGTPGHDQRAVDQAGVQVEDLAGVEFRLADQAAGADVLGRLQAPAAPEHR